MSDLRDRCVAALDRVMTDARRNRTLDLRQIASLARDIVDETPANLLAAVATAPAGRHAVDVALLSATLFPAFLPAPIERTAATQAALLHDIGLARIDDPDSVGRHPEFGADLLLGCRDIPAVAIEAAYCHHMRGHGHGYPTPRTALRPGAVTQVIGVVDLYLTLTRRRRRPLGHARALRTLVRLPGMEARRDILGLLADLPPIWPGSRVRLDGDIEGIYVAPGLVQTKTRILDVGEDEIRCVLLPTSRRCAD